MRQVGVVPAMHKPPFQRSSLKDDFFLDIICVRFHCQIAVNVCNMSRDYKTS